MNYNSIVHHKELAEIVSSMKTKMEKRVKLQRGTKMKIGRAGLVLPEHLKGIQRPEMDGSLTRGKIGADREPLRVQTKRGETRWKQEIG